MITIDPFHQSDLAIVIQYVEAIQEFERIHVLELKPRPVIGSGYASMLIQRVADRNGCMLMARAEPARSALAVLGFKATMICSFAMTPALMHTSPTFSSKMLGGAA